NLAGLLVNGGSASASGRPRSSNVTSVASSAPEDPTPIRHTRPSASKHGRQPPASELTVRFPAGAPLARKRSTASAAPYASSSSPTGNAVTSTTAPRRASATASS